VKALPQRILLRRATRQKHIRAERTVVAQGNVTAFGQKLRLLQRSRDERTAGNAEKGRTRMRNWVRLVVVALGFVMGGQSTAHALNFCFTRGVTEGFHASLAVAQKFRKPHNRNCSPIAGFDVGSADFRAVFGTACLNSVGDTLHVEYVSISRFRTPRYSDMDLPFPSLQGGSGFVSDDGSGVSGLTSTNAHANPCIPQVIPVP
jgi:hypothetical protein